MKDSPLKQKSMDFAVRIVKLNHWLLNEKREYSIADQLLRSGTSIGANLAEAEFASSKKDFLSKCKIALKECSETRFWLALLRRCDILSETQQTSILNECEELLKMLAASCRTLEERISE